MTEVIPIVLTAFEDSRWFAEPVGSGFEFYSTHSEPSQPAQELLQRIVAGEIELDQYEKLGEGTAAEVFKVGQFAVKRFRDWARNRPDVSGLAYLQASVALHEGLVATQPEPRRYDDSPTKYLFSAPEIYASFIPTEGAQDPFAIMSVARGEPSDTTELPTPPQDIAQSAYEAALAAAGVPDCAIFDPRAKDTLIRAISTDALLVTRLDVKGARIDVDVTPRRIRHMRASQ